MKHPKQTVRSFMLDLMQYREQKKQKDVYKRQDFSRTRNCHAQCTSNPSCILSCHGLAERFFSGTMCIRDRCTGTDKEIPERTWICTGEKQMGLCKKPEHRTGQEDCRSSHKICQREPCRYNCLRIPGDKRKDIREKETETASVEKTGYPETL